MNIKQIVLASRPKEMTKAENFRFEEIKLQPIKDGEVLLEPLYISVDPYMRGMMNDADSYVSKFEINRPIFGGVVAEVKESKTAKFTRGDRVFGTLPWATLTVAKADEVRLIDSTIPASYHLGVVGMPGVTAYSGLTYICQPKEGETVVISGAAGAVGTVVGQIAKIKGCRVVGIAGTDDKIRLLKEKYRFDEVINYKKTSDMYQAIKQACPTGVDCYYDNVGGDISDAVFGNLNRYGRVAICGQISLYNMSEIPMGLRVLPIILMKSLLVKGFIVNDYSEQADASAKQLIQWIKEDKLQYDETIIEGFDNLPHAFIGLFQGSNTGKMIVKI